MATRTVLPSIFRRLKSTAFCPIAASQPPKPDLLLKQNTPTPNTTFTDQQPIINLENHKDLFSSVSTPKLIKSSVTLYMSSVEPMVDLGMWIMNSKLMDTPILKDIILQGVEHSFFKHFCGGKDLKEAGETVVKLWDTSKITAMLDYGLEHSDSNDSCDKNLKDFVHTIESTMSQPVSFVVVKITAICPPNLLKRVSDLLRWEYKDKSLNLPWKLKTFPLFADSSPLYQTPTKPDPLTPQEEHDLQLAYQRLATICENSLKTNIPLLIDAEDTTIQPAIDYFTYSAAINYGRDDGPLLYNTIQAYLSDAKDRLVIAKRAADEMGVSIGFKLVRGAYMSSEAKLASSLGVKSPIHENIEGTHACYNQCASFMLHEIANRSGSVVLATHNLESAKIAATEAIGLGIKRDDPNLQFAQLYGMAESLSFGLRNAGFRTSKYLPFGPVDQVMPYLLRRAEENKGVFSTTSYDRQLMGSEILRRLQLNQF